MTLHSSAPSSSPPSLAQGSAKRELRGVLGVAVGVTALCLLTLVGFNVAVTRDLKSSYPSASGQTAAAAPNRMSAFAPAGSRKTAASADNLPATPASAGTSEDAVADANTPDLGVGSKAPGLVLASFAPPGADQIPDAPMGEVIRRGEQIFLNTGANAPAFVGNALNCVNCHLDAGRQAKSAPMWGAYPLYPAYRSKTKHVDTFAERLRGCFAYSMNGKAPPAGDDVLVALEAYAFWMAKGAPVGDTLPGAGYGKLPKPELPPDLTRGLQVFTANCALCHGADGQGQRSGDTQVFPPLWGGRSYNWGAGMHSIDTAAAFIQANMPLGRGGSLSVQEAWDVSAYMNSHERPQDPRFTGSVEATRTKFHDSPNSLYGTTVNGKLLGSGGQ